MMRSRTVPLSHAPMLGQWDTTESACQKAGHLRDGRRDNEP